MKFDVLTLFPGMFTGPFTESILKRGVEKGLLEIRCHNIRDYATDRHSTADDAPYGGGAGMVMKAEPIAGCLDAVRQDRPKSRVILTSPRGKRLSHEVAKRLAAEEGLIVICGRYEGIDERVRELFVDEEISLGDFVLTGGEIAAMAIVDAVARLVPGVLGSEESAEMDSFANGLLEYPQYTRPPQFGGLSVPDVLLSGNHAEIARWRRRQSLLVTKRSRPDLLDQVAMTAEDIEFLKKMADTDRQAQWEN